VKSSATLWRCPAAAQIIDTPSDPTTTEGNTMAKHLVLKAVTSVGGIVALPRRGRRLQVVTSATEQAPAQQPSPWLDHPPEAVTEPARELLLT
jgi:hypothetical protein